jgi:hypothetical protein
MGMTDFINPKECKKPVNEVLFFLNLICFDVLFFLLLNSLTKAIKKAATKLDSIYYLFFSLLSSKHFVVPYRLVIETFHMLSFTNVFNLKEPRYTKYWFWFYWYLKTESLPTIIASIQIFKRKKMIILYI